MMGKYGKISLLVISSVVVLAFFIICGTDKGVAAVELKKQYEYTDNYMVPFFNLSQNQKLVFDFVMDYSYAQKDAVKETELISVHTSISCDENSKIDCYEYVENQNGDMKLTIAPAFPVLPSDEIYEKACEQQEILDKEGNLKDYVSYWGMAPVYYICIRYDLESEELKKLDMPYIIPFTVKSEVEVPRVTAGLDDDGNFYMKWDEVEGATSYKIYKYVTDKNWTGEGNLDTHGSEMGYAEGKFYQWKEVTENYYSDLDEESNYEEIIQNMTISGTYFVSAVVDGKESNLSEPIYTSDYRLPYLISKETDIDFRYKNIEQLPRIVSVTNKDGTITQHSVSYQKLETYEYETDYSYRVDGTCLSGTVFVKNEGEMPDTISDTVKDSIKTNAQLSKLPSMAVESILSNMEEGSVDEIVKESKAETERALQKGNKIKVDIQTADYAISADSAEEAWLSYNLMDRQKEISLLAFPKLQNPYVLEDTLLKVCKQNPYIFGVYSYNYDMEHTALKIKYNESRIMIQKKQRFIYEEGKRIVSEIIKTSMTDEEKEEAIYNWLTNNVSYDREAYSEIIEDGFKATNGNKNTNDAYGILKDRKGTCSGYADVFKLLGDFAGLEVKTVTGYLDGNILHAWNLIKMKDSWYQTDCSNNENTIGIPKFLYHAGDNQAARNGYIMTKEALLDNEYYQIRKAP